MPQLSKIPATVVTGFLGSGKTTLLSHILRNAEGRRVAVIVNEFGELGIDGDLLKQCPIEGCEDDQKDDSVIELANGCLCCTVQEEFFPVMEELAKRRDDIDHVLIETSGLALPKPLVQAFNWPEIQSAFTVDAVITMVDGPAVVEGRFAANPAAVDAQRQADENLDHDASLHELFEDQLSAADLVILNKTDLLSDGDRQQVEAMIDDHTPEAVKQVAADHGTLPITTLLGLDKASEDGIDDRHDNHSHSHHHDHRHDHHHHHDHDHDNFDSFAVNLGEMDSDALLSRLHELVEQHDIFRIKGFVAVPGKAMRQVIQGVGKRFDRYFDRRWQSDEIRETRLIFIGKGLDQAAITHSLG